MGLAASQVRLQALTSESHNNNLRLLQLTMAKRTLSNEMQSVSRDYQNALSSKKMQWTNNSGITHSDISYSTLMRPNDSNMKSPVLITDFEGRVIIDTKYKKYAEMISSDGASHGAWEGSTRTSILSQLTGIPVETIETAESASALTNSAATKFSNAENDYDKWLAKETTNGGTNYLAIDKFAEKLGTSNGVDLAKLYKQGDSGLYSFNSSNDIKSLIDRIQNNIKQYFVDDDLLGDDLTEFIKACEETKKSYETALSGTANDNTKDALGISGSAGDYKVNIKALFDMIMLNYKGTSKTNSSGEKTYPLRDTSSESWKTWRAELDKRHEALESANTEYKTASEASSTAMTAEQESMLKFYDDLFTAVADNGWVYDAQIYDNDYINQMFQNNCYFVTTMTRNSCFDETQEEDSINWKYEYDTSTAATFDKIITINDNDAATLALAKYEEQKRKISDKESRIDLKMKDLETQQSAIKEMIEAIKKTKEDNIERTMNLWS